LRDLGLAGNFLGSNGADTAEECAQHTEGKHGAAFSFSDEISECWVYKNCDTIDKGNYVYNWSSYTLKDPDWMAHSLRFVRPHAR
jgi:hypothetical protein